MSGLSIRAPARPPRRIRTRADLKGLQRFMAAALLRSPTSDYRMRPRWVDGRSMAEVAAEFIKPSASLTAFERLEIYNRMVWFRLLDGAWDDCPGLRALMGEERFMVLIRAYLEAHPSISFTLRNLCSNLARFIASHPSLARPRPSLARDVARFEWARTESFDAQERPVIGPAQIEGADPSRMRIGVQPHVRLLELEYPVDDFVIAVRSREAMRSQASNAPGKAALRGKVRRPVLPRRERVRLAVHRQGERLYYRRLERSEFRILAALAEGSTLDHAIGRAGRGLNPERIRRWFEAWTRLGWLCRASSR